MLHNFSERSTELACLSRQSNFAISLKILTTVLVFSKSSMLRKIPNMSTSSVKPPSCPSVRVLCRKQRRELHIEIFDEPFIMRNYWRQKKEENQSTRLQFNCLVQLNECSWSMSGRDRLRCCEDVCSHKSTPVNGHENREVLHFCCVGARRRVRRESPYIIWICWIRLHTRTSTRVCAGSRASTCVDIRRRVAMQVDART
jgi:hypothetical protein